MVFFSHLIVFATVKLALLDYRRDMSSDNVSFTLSEVDVLLGGAETTVVSFPQEQLNKCMKIYLLLRYFIYCNFTTVEICCPVSVPPEWDPGKEDLDTLLVSVD